MKDFYRILGVPDNATESDIKSAYRRLAKLYHPDLNPGNKNSEEKFKEILDAYTILSDPDLRAHYDRKRTGSNFNDYFSQESAPENKKPKDPKRKEYPPEVLEQMRQRNRKRVLVQIQRRKKFLRGMIITFALYLLGMGLFELWVEKNREKQTQELNKRLAEILSETAEEENATIKNLDSPFDSLFGPAVSTWLSPNQLVVFNPKTDAVICLVQNNPPHRTIRNEFIHARKNFIMKELPNGNYHVKIYAGDHWVKQKKIPDGRKMGGFITDEGFYTLRRPAIILTKPTYATPNTRTSDTIVIDPAVIKFENITRDEFFSSGDESR